MNFLSKIKSFFKKPQKESFGLVFQDYLKIRAELQVSDIKMNGQGINFKVSYRGSIVPFWLITEPGITAEKAKLKIQDALALVAVGLAIDLNLVEISQALKNLRTSDIMPKV